MIYAFRKQKRVTENDKQHAHSLLHRIQLLEWVLGASLPFDELAHLMIDNDNKKWNNVMETTKSKKNS